MPQLISAVGKFEVLNQFHLSIYVDGLLLDQVTSEPYKLLISQLADNLSTMPGKPPTLNLPTQGAQDGPILEDPALEGRGMDLVERQPVAEDRPGLRELAPERGQRVILDLVDRGVETPGADIRVAPFRTDRRDDGIRRTGVEPGTEELLGEAVGSGDVDITDAGRDRHVEQLVRPSSERPDASAWGTAAPAWLVASRRRQLRCSGSA